MNFSALNSAGEERNIRVALAFGASLHAPSWQPHGDGFSSAEFTGGSADTIVAAGRVVYVGITYPGKTLDLDYLFPYSGNQFISHWHNGYQSYVGIYVKPVNATDELTVYGDIVWREYH
jgi:hypothetical protein